jgi:heptosyltransferase-2
MDILIIKVGALGDVVRTSFIAQALKDKYRKKNPKIFWITNEKAVPFFINNIYVDQVIKEEEKKFFKEKKWDLVINLEEDEDNCRFASSLTYGEIIGFTFKNDKVQPTKSTREWFDMSALGKKPQNDILKKRNKKTHRQIISEIIGIKDYSKYEPFLRLTTQQRKIASNFMRRHNLSRSDFIIGINTGSADRWLKQLPVNKTVELINKIYRTFKAKILLFGGPNEIERNNEILRLSRAPIISTGCGNDLIEFPALISACNLVVTTDSLGLHISLALKRKTICLIGPTSFSEIDMYGFGEKILAKSDCTCCFKKDCRSMESIDIEEIIENIGEMRKQKITILITAFKEKNLGKTIESVLNQKTEHEYDVLVSAPDEETLKIARLYEKKNKVRIFRDPGKGKSYALNMIFNKIDTDILILTDGDVTISDNAVGEIIKMFDDPEIGCLTGRPIPVEKKDKKYGYWANFLFEAAHLMRKSEFLSNSFIECSGYLFAFRKKSISKIPVDVAEDAVIPYFFWEKGYRIGYAENAQVFVKNADNLKDWMSQKTRTSRAHETLKSYVDIETTPRVKTFANESKGIMLILTYPKNLREFIWSLELIFARLYMWLNVFYKIKIKNQTRIDNWKRIESAR